ncbi:probable G-protein coupled receptor 132 isoform X1 [Trachemys scripta elegans]|uniref:probable G-protein coupled receptor 132 isoform X1 n=2 Tax=Trachemys scripta elegans TaxID=31138 RepID=UPI001552FAB0|nr:probable G-protein coupled receptor 132 isoform X1 [Trachemys scripta elegans]
MFLQERTSKRTEIRLISDSKETQIGKSYPGVSAHRCIPIMNESSSPEVCYPPMPYEDSRRLLVVCYSIVFALGLPANCFTTWLTFIQIRGKNVLAIYIFGLSLCELMYLSTLPLWAIYVQNQHRWEMGSMACKLTGYIFFCNIYISILLLCCISIDRYVAVVYALESKGARHQRTAIFITFILFSAVLVIHCPVFILQDGEQTSNRTTCFETLPLNLQLAYFNFARFLIGFAIPCIILIFTNYRIFQSTEISNSLGERQKAKVKYLAMAVITIFLICFAPYHLVLLIRSINFLLHQKDSCSFEHHIYSTSAAFLCLSTANSVADPIIYVLASEHARKDFYRSLTRRRYPSSTNTSLKLKNSKESQEAAQTSENLNLTTLSKEQ